MTIGLSFLDAGILSTFTTLQPHRHGQAQTRTDMVPASIGIEAVKLSCRYNTDSDPSDSVICQDQPSEWASTESPLGRDSVS
jgi:hypothetical protein